MTAPTLRDVAERAGVSIRTVSNVVNGYARVTDATKVRVQAAIDELGYRPNLMARNLKQGRTRIIALVVPALDVPYFAELVRLIIGEARARGYAVLIDQTDGDVERERELIMEASRAVSFDGVIASPLALTAADLESRHGSAPILLLGEKIFDSSADHVAIDNVTAAREMTAHLIGLGRRRIAAIGVHQDPTDGTAVLRTRGYREAFAQAGLTVDESLMVPTPHYERRHGAAAMARLLDRPEPPDAVFCFSDLLALGAMRVAFSRGLRIPEDLALAGFDDIEDGRYSSPTLTTIAPDKQQLARAAVEGILARIESGVHEAPVEITASHQLVVRESTVGGGVGRPV
ncbi:LacI family DNA-binding transcriptional regulator [Streptomyces sp. NPDC093261]|uniref:LacI family DNA-binding transcriptional regulator n=1 Tax=Streptomyces sp. NPDC093261 TaxID=3366037 RepID=UPI00380BE1EC